VVTSEVHLSFYQNGIDITIVAVKAFRHFRTDEKLYVETSKLQ